MIAHTPLPNDDAVREPKAAAPLYLRIMGESWTQIAEPIRRMHSTHRVLRARGCFRIEQGNPAARVLARTLRLPQPSAAADTTLIVTAVGDSERWLRTFGDQRRETRQYESSERRLAERYGLLEICYQLDVSAGSLLYVQRRVTLLLRSLRVPLPRFCTPRVLAREDAQSTGSVKVTVRVTLPGIGRLIGYDGIISLEE